MAQNRGKQFEEKVRQAFLKVPGVSIDRLHDQTTGYRGSQNICDFIVYRKPVEYYIECKTVHGNTLSIHGTKPENKYGNITNTQWEGLSEKSKIPGVHAGVLCWWVDKDITKFIPIQVLEQYYKEGYKSIRFDDNSVTGIAEEADGIITYYWCREIPGKKKRVFFDYDMRVLFNYEEVKV